MADVKWIKIKVGMFDGDSFKKIKRAKIGGESWRDKLTAVWFELLDLAGKGNKNGILIDSNEMPFVEYEDIAIMIDREKEEIEVCMQFFIKEKMIEIIDNVYCLSNFIKYQNESGLDAIREKSNARVKRYRDKKNVALQNVTETLQGVTSNVTKSVTKALPSISISNISISNSLSLDNKNKEKEEIVYFNNPRINASFCEWIAYKIKREKKKEPYVEIGLQKLISEINNKFKVYGEVKIIEAINMSMARNYKGIIWELVDIKKNNVPLPDWYANYESELNNVIVQPSTKSSEEVDDILEQAKNMFKN